ncbi:flagellar basal body rod protein FlgC [Flocculibacter collagenilyticus]|uniref:flagellar basal body rod protein FlgC n=1 Tax=Flocculibacter collagenilyticus TaxID=2744479 RepID=UPI0018F4F773|nr:flagellar basal body rod protein FlgC [Flocculibacter collagenilyticus]
MAVTEILNVSEYGMHYQKMRIDAATLNISNANIVQPSDGKGFKPLEVTVNQSFESTLFDKSSIELKEVAVTDRVVFQPDHPAADSKGYVRFANVDMAKQMVTLTQATRAYEANIKAFNTQMNMSLKALEIGK